MLGSDGTYTLRLFTDLIDNEISPKTVNISHTALCVLTIYMYFKIVSKNIYLSKQLKSKKFFWSSQMLFFMYL